MTSKKNIKTTPDGYDAAHAAKGQNESWNDALKRLAAEDPKPRACRECGGPVEAFIVKPLPGMDGDPQPVREAEIMCQDETCGESWTWERGGEAGEE